ncbi:MAG: hypothetical protein Q7I98_07885, partial [Erysipelotrichaceae bacterium]|nr:hypothetical protein [Erysipelotrichaceae bacterium]
MVEKAPISTLDEYGDFVVVGDLLINNEDGEQHFSKRTLPELPPGLAKQFQKLVNQFSYEGLPLPRYLTLRGLWPRFWSMI